MTEKISKLKKEEIPYYVDLLLKLNQFEKKLGVKFTAEEKQRKYYQQFIPKALNSNNNFFLTAKQEGRIVGILRAEIKTAKPLFAYIKYGFINQLYVEPAYHHQDLGKALVKKMVKIFQKQKIKKIKINVLTANFKGVHFWERRGFEEKSKIMELK